MIGIGKHGITAADVLAVARRNEHVELSGEAVAAMAASRYAVETAAAGRDPVYGVSTGFGALATRHIEQRLRARLQRSLSRSACRRRGRARGNRSSAGYDVPPPEDTGVRVHRD